MSTVAYDFRERLTAGEQGERRLDAFFRQWYSILPATPTQQRQGIDRIFTIMKQRLEKEQQEGKATIRPNEIEVFVMAFGGKTFNGLLLERMSVADQLWKAGIKAEYAATVKPRLPTQFKQAENGGVPLAVILGEDEVAAGQVKLKVLGLPDGHPEKDGRLISRDDLVSEVKKALQK